MWFLMYALSSVIIILHYVGVLARNNLQWLVYVLVVTIIPAIIWLKAENRMKVRNNLKTFTFLVSNLSD